MLDKLESKLSQIMQQLEQSAANHNYLLGCKAAIENMMADLKTAAPIVEEVVDVVAPADAPVVNEAISTVENVI